MADPTQDQINNKIRFNEQCFLLDNFEKIASFNEKTTPSYRNFLMVNGEPGLVVHELVGKKGVEDLLELTPVQKALLMPKIQIFKIKYPGFVKSKKIIPKEGKDFELVFGDHTSKKSIENIMKSKAGRGDDVGIKSFEYTLSGKNPAEGGLAKCNLKIYFQNIEALVKSGENEAAFIDLVRPEAAFVRKQNKDCKQDETRIPNSKFFRIKIVAGWANPMDPTGTIISDKLKKTIQRSKTVLYLQLIRHNIDFRDNGSVQLEVEYQGAMEGALNSPSSDILSMTALGKVAKKELDEKAAAAAKLKKENKKKKGTLEKIKGSILNRDQADDKNTVTNDINLDRLGALTKEQKEKIESLWRAAFDRQFRYSRILDALQKNRRIHSVIVKSEHVENYQKEVNNIIKAIKEQEQDGNLNTTKAKEITRALAFVQRAINESHRRSNNLQIETYDATIPESLFQTQKAIADTNILKNNVKTTMGVVTANTVGVKSKEEKKKIVDGAVKKLISTSEKNRAKNGAVKIDFFYFGDLLEIVLRTLTNKERQEADALFNMNILLGPIVFKDPRNPSQLIIRNLADVPISLNLFLTWYLRTVIAPQRERYVLGQFIKDIIQKLITPALGEQCFSGIGNQQVHVSLNHFTLPGKKNPLSGIPGRADIKLLRNRTGEIASQSTHHDAKDLHSFIYIYVSSWNSSVLKGDVKEDFKRGIYHLTMGSDRGLVKSIKFRKTDQPYVAEMRATQDTSDSKRLRDRYNATVTMIGNNLFKNGMYVYLDTALMGMGRPAAPGNNSIASQLGIGGYYVITKVNQITSDDSYETELECEWSSSGRTKDKCEKKAAAVNSPPVNKKNIREALDVIYKNLPSIISNDINKKVQAATFGTAIFRK